MQLLLSMRLPISQCIMWERRILRQPVNLRSFILTSATSQSHAIVYHEDFTINPIPKDHRFPMPKDHLLYTKLVKLNLADRLFKPVPPDIDTLSLAHDINYINSFIDGSISEKDMRRIGLKWSELLVRRTIIGVGSAILASRLALQFGVAIMCNGGTHHAHPSHGSGFCIFNDLAVSARALQRDVGINKILFVDLDVHAGDGTAAIFSNDPSVFTLSLHCEAQPFPILHVASDVDVPLPAECTDEHYMSVLKNVLPPILDDFQPEIVLYNAGTDVHKDDTLGMMALTNDGIYERDVYVLSLCCERGIPVAAAIGGGYEPDHEKIVERHVLLHKAAALYADSFMKMIIEKRRKN